MTALLTGCAVVVTREQPGELGRLLDEQGATVIHVPLIEVVDADPSALSVGWTSEPDWLIVSSAAGAERVAEEVAARGDLRVAAVGTATARRLEELGGRRVDLIPERQSAAGLVDEFLRRNKRRCRVLVAQADRAAPTLVDGLRAGGHEVIAVVAYRTRPRRPDDHDLEVCAGANAVVFASGSAARSWAEAFGDLDEVSPRLVVAIGPTTAAAAVESGLKVSHVAADHSLAGIVDELINAWVGPR